MHVRSLPGDGVGETTCRCRSDPEDSHASISAGLPTVADKPIRCRSRPANRSNSGKDRKQMPASVVTGERMKFIDDDRSDVLEELPMVDLGRDQNGFE